MDRKMTKEHTYSTTVTWTGNKGEGTIDYKDYTRHYDIECEGKPVIRGSADLGYMADAACHSPKDMLLAALSACHMLWYLHLCAISRVIVTAYKDISEGVMQINPDGSGNFKNVTLKPRITIAPTSDLALAERLHEEANAMCFIARSVNFSIKHDVVITRG